MPNHPQIPDHPRFRSQLTDDGEPCYGFRTELGWTEIRWLAGLERDNCANAARAAWLDAMQECVFDHYGFEFNKCARRADAWAEWAKGDDDVTP